MKKAKKVFLTTLVVLVILIVLFLFYKLFILRIISINSVKNFMQEQGADIENIEVISAGWDPIKSGGYTVSLKVKDDPEREYFYSYKLIENTGGILDFKFDSVRLVYVGRNGQEDFGAKYGKLNN